MIGETAMLKKIGKHRLGRHELRENQHLQDRVVQLALLLLNAVEQCFGLDVRTAGFAAPRGRQQEFHLLALVLEALQVASSGWYQVVADHPARTIPLPTSSGNSER